MASATEQILCDGTEPPACCRPRPVMTGNERLRRLKAELKATAPYTCPHCSAGGPVPAFVRGADVWICADWRCARWFVVRD